MTFSERFESAKKRGAYWTQRAILEFTEAISKRMDELGINRTELAERLDSSPAYVTKILRGDTNFTIGTQVKIAQALDCELKTTLAPETSTPKARVIQEAREKTEVSAGSDSSE